jgi:hypothetical protein
MFAAEWGTGQVFWSMLYFFLFVIWFWLLIVIFSDIFKSPDLSGGAKAVWSIFVIVLPFLGVFVYLIARGRKMSEHAMDEAKLRDDMVRAYMRDVTANTDGDSLSKLASLKSQGIIDDAEYERLRAKVAGAPTA